VELDWGVSFFDRFNCICIRRRAGGCCLFSFEMKDSKPCTSSLSCVIVIIETVSKRPLTCSDRIFRHCKSEHRSPGREFLSLHWSGYLYPLPDIDVAHQREVEYGTWLSGIGRAYLLAVLQFPTLDAAAAAIPARLFL
jgi:hypothetical protein